MRCMGVLMSILGNVFRSDFGSDFGSVFRSDFGSDFVSVFWECFGAYTHIHTYIYQYTRVERHKPSGLVSISAVIKFIIM